MRDDNGISSGHEEISSAKRRKGCAGFAAVLVMGGALAYGYTRYTAYQKEQEAEAEHKQAERARQDSQRYARQQSQQRQYLGDI